ncbi:MAG: hypothetical protein F9K29_20390 [Hyphomicrobiaceae bacterium]|nr:MAG: hypothetical protein F9K29_20390 [Hyphomicrobiaceae bacterium]
MKSKIIAPIAAAAALIAFAGAAAACPPGYHKVKIQGNWICALDASASNNLAAKSGPTLPKQTSPRRR